MSLDNPYEDAWALVVIGNALQHHTTIQQLPPGRQAVPLNASSVCIGSCMVQILVAVPRQTNTTLPLLLASNGIPISVAFDPAAPHAILLSAAVEADAGPGPLDVQLSANTGSDAQAAGNATAAPGERVTLSLLGVPNGVRGTVRWEAVVLIAVGVVSRFTLHCSLVALELCCGGCMMCHRVFVHLYVQCVQTLKYTHHQPTPTTTRLCLQWLINPSSPSSPPRTPTSLPRWHPSTPPAGMPPPAPPARSPAQQPSQTLQTSLWLAWSKTPGWCRRPLGCRCGPPRGLTSLRSSICVTTQP